MFGEITNAKLLDGWNLNLQDASKMPQDVATAFTALYSELVGGNYVPVYYVGSQLVNGTNHKLIVERNTLVSSGKQVKSFAVVTINIPIGSVGGVGATKVSEEDVNDFVLRDDIEKGFKRAQQKNIGVTFKPILELGTQVVKGTNYHFICETTISGQDLPPYLTRIVVNNFGDNWVIDQVIRL